MGAFFAAYGLEVAFASTFLGGMSIYSYFKLRGKKTRHIQYYDLTDRIIKGKKLQKRVNDKVGGGANKGDVFFKGSK